MSEDVIIGLDIGSHAVRVAVGQPVPSVEGKTNQMHIIGAIEVPSEGMSRGNVSSIEDAVSSVSKVLEQTERLTGLPLSRAWVGISGTHIIAQESRGVIGVARSDGEIREEDVERAIEAARTVAMPTNHEILHVIPRSFTVDGQRGIKDPVGMNAIRLEVDALIIQGLSSQIKNLTKCVYRTGLDIEDLVFSILATAEAVVTNKQKDLGVCVINIGASTTSLIIFEEGDVLHTVVLPIGSSHITSDLAIGLRTSLDVAEQVKIRYGHALPEEVDKKEEINLAELGAQDEEYVGRRFIADIIEARVQEIFEKVDAELSKVERSGMLPAGVVLTGGGAKLAGMLETAKRSLRLPTSLGTPIGVTSVVERMNDPAMSTAIGLVLWGYNIASSTESHRFSGVFSKVKNVKKMASGLGKWFKSLHP
ncbi:MAG: Cell division protein ftsA [Candidatus Uhrbacteria bacterium GW2011_GWF2_41_16]|uniref:Cell division protein FtsA n=2 Tax=Candidatus Uhriibacteriota TaxID=1752732 RepID=A0A0G0XPN0_9BACT|nr:MAG: Cell division protein ftsA [Candidatus Uhrbacteria bacterium GW2011_GWA2_41_10]KKR87831.1 MAG: Cell division protein ftsA [Candidatus Uhrbacteria bacterium GW2011_GWC2_41_11]KKR98770.1 MAG: Cell division protein ftsA [Candidatus Uhrbacteria bacterium GW2011_GWF2_41_16]HBP00112.1 cell division protein FtsA [Candidatus Uhrbacteria bacterium]